jgi:hypothetical protein
MLGMPKGGETMSKMLFRACVATLLAGAAAVSGAAEQPVVAGVGNDYQAAVIQPWAQPQQRIAVFERLGAGFSGDLWLTRSDDAGASWEAPVALFAGPGNERHASLIQTGDEAYVLVHLSNASGGFRIHRATSGDGTAFVAHGPIDLGWPTAGEINPHLMREPDGSLILSYHRLGGAAYIARSEDDGASWDTLRTQVSPGNAALPRLARRASDGRYLLTYQTGANPVTLWARTSADPYQWSTPPVQVVADGNNHDGWPMLLDEDRFVVFWARAVNGAFQIHASHSSDGSSWSMPVAYSDRPGLNNVQPYALKRELPGRAELYWGAAQVPGDSNYDIVRLASVQVFEVEADLSVLGQALASPVACEATVHAEFLLQNAGPALAAVEVIFDSSSAAGVLDVSEPMGWSCQAQGSQWHCQHVALEVGGGTLFDVAGSTLAADCGGQVVLSALAASSSSVDPDHANDFAEVAVQVSPAPPPPIVADLQLSAQPAATPIACEAVAEAHFVLVNAGPDPAGSVAIAFSSSSGGGITAVRAPVGWNCISAAATWTCGIDALAPGPMLPFEVEGPATPQDCGGTVVLGAEVDSANDPVADNDVAEAAVEIEAMPPAPDAIFSDGFESSSSSATRHALRSW